MNEFDALLTELSDDAEAMISACSTEAEIADVQALFLGKNGVFKQMEKALWSKKPMELK